MQFGVCGGAELAPIAAKAGYDYLETTVGGLLKPLEDEAAFAAALATFQEAPLSCPVLNCFVPGSLPITGPAVDFGALQAYVTTTCERAARAAVDTIVFGSGGARRIPEGFERQRAWKQLVDFGRMVAPIAAANGVTIAVEPLNLKECNVLTTVGESADYVREVNHPAFRLLVDGYHWALDNDSVEGIVQNGSLLRHTHVATVPNRLAPGREAYDFTTFFEALKAGGYKGRMSIEGKLEDPAETLAPALKLMRGLV